MSPVPDSLAVAVDALSLQWEDLDAYAFPPAALLGQFKSRVSSLLYSKKSQIKICEKCFLCHSIVLCSSCNKCPKCCTKSACRGQTSELLENFAGSGCRSESCSNPERGLYPPLSVPAKTHKVPHGHKLICQSPQEQLPVGGITSAYNQNCCRASKASNISGVFQLAISSPKAQQQVETYTRSEQIESFPQGGEIQNGDTRNHQNVPPKRGVGHLNRLQGCLLPYTDAGTVQEISEEISCRGSDIPIQGTVLWSVHSTLGVHCNSKEGETDGHTQGYKDPPVPRRLRARSHQACLQHTQTLVEICQDLGWLVNLDKSELDPKQIFDFVGYQFDLQAGRVRPTPDRWQTLQGKILEILSLPTCPVRQFMSLIGLLTATEKQVHLGRLHMRPIQWHLKNHWRIPESLEKVIPIPRSLHPHLQWWLQEDDVLTGQPLHPIRHALQIFTDASKEGWGAHLNERTARGTWSLPESKLHINYLGLKAVFLALKEFQDLCANRIVLVATDNTTVVSYINKEGGMRSAYSSIVHKQGRRHEVGHSLCPTMEDLDLVYQTSSNSKSPTHSGSTERGSRQAISFGIDHSNRMVPPSRGFPNYMQQVALISGRSICHEVQQQVTSVRVTSTGFPGSSSGRTQSPMGGSRRLRLPTSSHIGQSGGETTGLPLQDNHSDCSGVAQHALVLGSSDHVQSDPTEPAQSAQPVDTALQSDPSQKSDKSKSPCMAPRAAAIKEQGFSETVAARIEAPQRGSTRSVYEAKWTIFKKWCITNQVDFRAPPVKSVADFLMYLFEDRKLQPSTIDGYRSAIADKLGNSTLNISRDENLTRLLDSFHRDRPKGRRGIPSWNLSLVLHQLMKVPFEPIKETSLKYLTFKTVFLLALGSGKRRSEIHAWQNRNIRHQSDWSKVSLYPSPSFLSKNQLAKEGPDSVAPVVIPALAPTLDRSLKSDRSLCPVRALRYYLDRTSDLRQNKELVFVSFKRGFGKDISPATISSWIKQTVILCYELADQEAHTLHQVKAHDVRAFAASKAFQSGVSLEQILSACHWKSHNTFAQCYLKDVAWADSELYHLGPVVAAQQIHK